MSNRFWLALDMENPEWREVSEQEYVRAERRAGFHNTMGKPDKPATAAFGGSGVRGTTLDPTVEVNR